jgi:hypothetical protein
MVGSGGHRDSLARSTKSPLAATPPSVLRAQEPAWN